MRKILVALSIIGLAGCASNEASLQRATAMNIGQNVAPDQVRIVSVDRGAMETSWTAEANGHNYACSSDDMIRRPYCVRR